MKDKGWWALLIVILAISVFLIFGAKHLGEENKSNKEFCEERGFNSYDLSGNILYCCHYYENITKKERIINTNCTTVVRE